MWEDVILFVAVGVAAQLVDGAIGMAYGVTGTTVLLSLGLPPATASASVHAAEVFTTAISGCAHARLGNVDGRLLRQLAIPGVFGGAAGAYILTAVPGEAVRPVINVYLALTGVWIVVKAIKRVETSGEPPGWVSPLGFLGGLVDAVGGGGWGPLVTSTLVGRGTTPRYAIGSVNAAEFFVTVTISLTFLFTIGLELWPIIAGLVLGGALAAPLAAYLTRQLPDRPMMILVGTVILVFSLRGLVQGFG